MSASFGIGTFSFEAGEPEVGLVLENEVAQVAKASAVLLSRASLGDRSLRALLESWDDHLPGLQQLADLLSAETERARRLGLLVPLAQVVALPPIAPTAAVFCAGANFRTHVEQLSVAAARNKHAVVDEVQMRAAVTQWLDLRVRTGRPYVFLKLARIAVGACADLVIPRDVTECDFELELGAVIGRGGYRIERAHALQHVAGYTICNDVTARESVMRADSGPLGADWLAGKCAPTFLPIGPMIVPRQHAAEVGAMRLALRLNGEPMQDACASDLLFDLPALIAHVSAITPLQPGDVILTGSPAGNGAHHGRFLKPGDVLDCTISGLGNQRNRCVAEASIR
jgi:2-keto-4-pentenoate hydratase/2-oxohepta-3-ene-1,7-dioic acid hydratase in catechol pathway